MSNNWTAIILAAGVGTRMKSSLPKVLHQVCGRPMLAYVLDLAKGLGIKNILVVTGHKRELLKDLLTRYKAKEVYQDKRLGTADAIKRCQPALRGFSGNVLVLYGDQPLLKKETLQKLIQRHTETKAQATILSAYPQDPFGYGRIIRDNFSRITAIVEEKDASAREKEVGEINTGIICFKKDSLFKTIPKIKSDNTKKEYYLTDAIKIMAREGALIESVSISQDVQQAQGINSRIDLAQALKAMRLRILAKFMLEGVTVIDPDATYIEEGVRIGRDTVIYPFTFIEKDVIIGNFCQIGPFCHLRPETVIEDRVTVGNFTEITRSRLGRDSFMKHFSYLGDTVAGKAVNIGCGTVVANFDGRNKNKTVIEDQAFIGSDTVLRAPVRIGKKAVTGAGSVVTKDVAAGTVVAGVPARILKKDD
ncbi:MAG TPA: NTP transferase domain-containing protein [Candidatus Omnitrophota bacterium]|nr:NTP transferase domain-containing protein [Candidatus Omnitrophota bacterium]